VPPPLGQAPVEDLDAAYFDDPVTQFGVETGGLGVEDNGSHRGLACLASPAARAD